MDRLDLRWIVGQALQSTLQRLHTNFGLAIPWSGGWPQQPFFEKKNTLSRGKTEEDGLILKVLPPGCIAIPRYPPYRTRLLSSSLQKR